MLTFLWGFKELIPENDLPRGITINGKTYRDLLENYLKLPVRPKHRCSYSFLFRLSSTSCIFTRSHISWYKEALEGKKLSRDDETKEAVHRSISAQRIRHFFPREIQELMNQWQICIKCGLMVACWKVVGSFQLVCTPYVNKNCSG